MQRTPDGDVAVVYLKADDLQAAFARLGSSQDRSTAGSAMWSARSTVSTWRGAFRRPSTCWLPGRRSVLAHDAPRAAVQPPGTEIAAPAASRPAVARLPVRRPYWVGAG